MITSRLRVFSLLSLLLCLAATANAQTSAAATQLAVEIRYNADEQSPAYIVVDGSAKHSIWFGRFPRVAGWLEPANSLPVTAVNINAQQAEDGVRVWVSVFLGKIHEEEKQVSSYVLREGDTTVAKELAAVGVVPFEFKAVRLATSAAYIPNFKSKPSSIELVSIQPNFSAIPTVKLVLRNVSSKPVHAMEVLTVTDGVPRLMYMPQATEGEALIPPGGTVEVKTHLTTRYISGANGYALQTPPNQSIEIATAVFSDGSYEGESGYAMTFLGYQKGRKAQLARVFDLLEKAANGTTEAAALKEKLSALNIEADSAAIEELQRQFPQENLERVKTAIQVGMRGLRDEVLRDLIQCELHNRYSGNNAYNACLTSSVKRYQAWLNRL
jgi:hypothetical protein